MLPPGITHAPPFIQVKYGVHPVPVAGACHPHVKP